MKKENKEGYGYQVPPDREQVNIYFASTGYDEKEAEIFYRHYSMQGWKNRTGNLLQNWKKLAWTWILNLILEEKILK